MLTPLRSSAWRNPRSALVALHSVEEGVEHAGIVITLTEQARAFDDLGTGSISELVAGAMFVDRDDSVTTMLPGSAGISQAASTSTTTHQRQRTSTRYPGQASHYVWAAQFYGPPCDYSWFQF